jgi:undecaprenyl diphosphate synthase
LKDQALADATFTSLPKHVAIIMDGNGRWANQRGLPRTAGHRQGIEALRRTVKAAGEFGIKYLTIYSFSTENWSRPPAEVSFLLELMRRFIGRDVAELHAAGVCVKIIGIREGLERSIIKMIEEAEHLTRDNHHVTLTVAFNYGSRSEIVRAAKSLATEVVNGTLKVEDITEQMLEKHLDTRGMPDPDLLIRTGGEMRISNFLMWQHAYAEFVFVPEYWPDFNADIFRRAIMEYGSRDRRFGGVKAKLA